MEYPIGSIDFSKPRTINNDFRHHGVINIALQYIVREASKAAGLWAKAPYMVEISVWDLRVYDDHVIF